MKGGKAPTVLIGVTGSIAAYKVPLLARELRKNGFSVLSVLTRNARRFVTPWTMEAVTGAPCFDAMFYRRSLSLYPHIELSRSSDILVVAPASANFIAKAAWGIADDLLSTLFLTCTCPKLLAPAMNSRMLLNPQTQANIRALKERGVLFVDPESGHLACGEEGAGRMAEPAKILKKVREKLRAHG